MIANKISTEMSLQRNLPFYECPHTCRIDITSMYINKHNLFILIYILRRRNLYTHLTMPPCFISLRYTHICIFQHWRNRDIYYHYHLRTHWGRLTHIHVSGIKLKHFLNKCRFNINLAFFDIRIGVGLWSVCCRFVIGLSSGLSVLSVTIPSVC